MRYISTLKEGQRISEIYLCKTKTVANTKTGKTYYSLTLQDKTGIVNAKIWDLTNAIHDFEALDYIAIDADVTVFMNALQLNIRRLRLADKSEYDTGDYMPVSPYDREEMYRELVGYVNSIGNDWLRSLAASFFKNADFAEKTDVIPVETSHTEEKTSRLKEPADLGELVKVACLDGARVFNPDWSMKYAGFPQGTKLHFTGKTAERPGFPQYTYCEVYEEPRKFWVAVHDGQTQILDNSE